MSEYPNKLKDSTSESIARKFVKFVGLSITVSGFVAVVISYLAFATGMFYSVWTRTRYFGLPQNTHLQQILEGVFFITGFLSLLVLSIGFLIYSKWREDLSFNKQKLVILTGFMLFFPVTTIHYFGAGVFPPSFAVFSGICGAWSCIYREMSMFFVGIFATLLISAVLFLFGHIFSSFVYKYTKNKYIAWAIFTVLALTAFYGKYIWGDFGGGEHGGNIINLFADFFS
jgi:hypothetical protein